MSWYFTLFFKTDTWQIYWFSTYMYSNRLIHKIAESIFYQIYQSFAFILTTSLSNWHIDTSRFYKKASIVFIAVFIGIQVFVDIVDSISSFFSLVLHKSFVINSDIALHECVILQLTSAYFLRMNWPNNSYTSYYVI